MIVKCTLPTEPGLPGFTYNRKGPAHAAYRGSTLSPSSTEEEQNLYKSFNVHTKPKSITTLNGAIFSQMAPLTATV